ncbi:MAG: endolytic transglycosylase MltG [Solirubrobacterales bacterium]
MSEDWSGDPFADPDDPRAREREQRRLEREEKRRRREEKKASKEKAAAPPPPEPKAPAEPPKPPRTPEQEFWDEDPPTPEPDAATKAGAAEPAVDRPAEESAAEKLDARGKAVAAAAAAGAAETGAHEPVAAEPPTPEPAVEQSYEHEYEPRQAPAEDWGFHEEGDPEMAGAARRGGRGGGRRGFVGSLLRHPFRIAAVILAIIVVWFLWSLFQPFHGDGSGRAQVTVPKGSSVSEVGDLLDEKGVISSSTFFQIRVTIEGKRSDLYAGHFTLAHDMSYGAAIDALSKPPVKRITTVTIPEGYSRPQAAELVEEDGVPGSYTKATVRSKFLDPADYGGKGAKNLEGFLFPDTFELKPKAPVADLVELQLKDFKKKIKKVDMKYAKSKNLTVFDVLTIASMVEREAGVAKQRGDVASVIYNRLHEGMPLGIDATTRFATGNYSKPLTESELAVDSPYNTRTNSGLPPGPINSPGLAAIKAAAHPPKTRFLFYVNKPSTCGELAFSKNEAEWEEDVAAYNRAREANGGNEPTSCGE